jgi:nicotinamidase/pyrazinamidase
LGKIGVGSDDALIVVDLQIDFCTGGALAVPEGDAIVESVNRLMGIPDWIKVATRDWHPSNHISFKERGGGWSHHCIAGTEGAKFHPGFETDKSDLIISKAATSDAEAYSGFDGTNLRTELKSRGVKRIFVCGLATDYCVRATALDGRKEGFEVYVLEDAIRAVDMNPGDGDRSKEEMRIAGCLFSESRDLIC